MSARQCPRRLWLERHRPSLAQEDAQVRWRMAQGQALQAVFRGLHPGGRLLDTGIPRGDAVAQTRDHVRQVPAVPLFEGTFAHAGLLVRADLYRQRDGAFELVEVKSSTRVRSHHLLDVAIQAWTLRGAGYRVDRPLVAHVDTRFRYRGGGDYAGLLRQVDVGEQLVPLLAEVPRLLDTAQRTLDGADEPAIEPGAQCRAPYPCPFRDHCRRPGPRYPVELLPADGRLVAQLHREGYRDLREVPAGRLHKPLHERIRQATVSGETFLDPALPGLLRALPYPRAYLDFEAIQFTVPRWPDTRPYESLPFQWSCHVEPAPGRLLHREFLDSGGAPPMRACAEALLAALGDDGPILCYSPFERGVIGRLAARFPDLHDALHALAARLVDLLPLVRAHYYHPAMKGSFSLKAVLPTVSPQHDYQALGPVRDGVGAQVAYHRLLDEPPGSPRRDAIADALRAYCRLDTLALVEIVRGLQETGRAG